MGTDKILSVIFLILLVIIRAADASPRILMADEKPSSDKVSPSPTPNSPSVNKELNQNPQPTTVEFPHEKLPNDSKKDEGLKENKSPPNANNGDGQKESKDPPKNEEKKNDDKKKESTGPSKSPENVKKDDAPKANDAPSKSEEDKKKNDRKQESKGSNGEESHVDNKAQLETCDGSLQKCQQQDLVACLQHSETADSKELVILVLNAGDNTLNVNIAAPTSSKIDAKMLNLAKHNAKKLNVSAGAAKSLEIVLNAGKGNCVIQIGIGPSISDWIQQFPVYASQLTPMYGAYFAFFILVIAGGIWGFCKFRRGRRADRGVPYQQLEMGSHRQSSSEIVEASTVDGWEQGWGDDWDEEEASARPSATSPNGNVSSNGLSSRSANKKNDWDIEWDD